MPPILGSVGYLFLIYLQSIILIIQSLFYVFVRPIQDNEENNITRSAGSPTVEVHTQCIPPLTSPIYGHLEPPPNYKKKALLVGVESTAKGCPRTLEGAHDDVMDARQFLVGRFLINTFRTTDWPVFWQIAVIMTQLTSLCLSIPMTQTKNNLLERILSV